MVWETASVWIHTSTHHQERIQLYLQHLVFVTPLLLSAAIVEVLEPVWVFCGWRRPPTACHVYRSDCHVYRSDCHIYRSDCHVYSSDCHVYRSDCHMYEQFRRKFVEYVKLREVFRYWLRFGKYVFPLSLMSHGACCHTCYTIQLMHYSHFKIHSLKHLKRINF
jgi:hypothetical protein